MSENDPYISLTKTSDNDAYISITTREWSNSKQREEMNRHTFYLKDVVEYEGSSSTGAAVVLKNGEAHAYSNAYVEKIYCSNFDALVGLRLHNSQWKL